MTKVSATQARVFLIDTFYQGRDLALTFRLDQMCARPCVQRDEDRLYNQVQQHLSELGRRTGFDYSIRYWGPPDGADQYIEDQQITIH